MWSGRGSGSRSGSGEKSRFSVTWTSLTLKVKGYLEDVEGSGEKKRWGRGSKRRTIKKEKWERRNQGECKRERQRDNIEREREKKEKERERE